MAVVAVAALLLRPFAASDSTEVGAGTMVGIAPIREEEVDGEYLAETPRLRGSLWRIP